MEKTNWFEDEDFWISTSSLLNNRVRLENGSNFVKSLIDFADMKPSQSLLDLGCGIGKFTVEFAKRGLKATGLDITEAYLKIGKKIASDEKVPVDFINTDMRSFSLPHPFDFVLILGNSFGFFEDIEDDKKVLECVFSSLKEGGKFIIELYGKEMIAANFKKKSVYDGDEYTIITDSEILHDWSWITNKLLLIKNNEVKNVTYSHRLFTAVEIKSLLYSVGFNNVSVFGSLSKAKYDDSAKGLFVIAEK